jgi:dienelactone hydrolase
MQNTRHPAKIIARLLQWPTRAIILLAVTSMAADPSSPEIDRSHLLAYRDQAGGVAPVRTTDDWLKRRASIVSAMEQIMGPLPGAAKRCPLDMKVEEDVDCGSYTRMLISYASEPGGRVPAYLLVPKDALAGKRKAKAILCLHPTEASIGFKVVVGLGGKPHRDYARELAERGFVTLAPSYPLLANYQPDIAALGYESGTMKAIWDNIRGIDLLESLPYVKADGFGVIGHSLGGHNSVFTAVFDARIKVIVSSSGLDSFSDYFGGDPKRWRAGQGWCQTRYMPKLAAYAGRLSEIPFDFPELVGALAPRVCFISAPLKDANFSWQSVDRVAAAARQIYALYGKPNNLLVEHPDSEHDFPDAMREKAYKLFEDCLP